MEPIRLACGQAVNAKINHLVRAIKMNQPAQLMLIILRVAGTTPKDAMILKAVADTTYL